jgi:uncharacterized protein YtpQ (UPF0354 family)
MRWLAIGIGVVIAAVAGVTFVRWSMDRATREFQRVAIEVLRERFPDRTFVADEDPLTISLPKDKVRLGLVNLRAIVDRSGGSDAERREIIAKFFAQSLAAPGEVQTGVPQNWDAARPLIRPQLVSTTFQTDTDVRLIRRHVIADLDLVYVIDMPRHVSYIGETNLETWKVEQDALAAAAMENLEQAIAQETLDVTPAQGVDARGRFVTVATEDGFAAARVMVPSFRKRLGEALGEPYFVATPNRDFLVAWSADYSHRDAFVAKVRQDARTRPYAISGAVLKVAGGDLREP